MCSASGRAVGGDQCRRVAAMMHLRLQGHGRSVCRPKMAALTAVRRSHKSISAFCWRCQLCWAVRERGLSRSAGIVIRPLRSADRPFVVGRRSPTALEAMCEVDTRRSIFVSVYGQQVCFVHVVGQNRPAVDDTPVLPRGRLDRPLLPFPFYYYSTLAPTRHSRI